jgi:transmembrane sensor
MMDQMILKNLLKKYNDGIATPAEVELLESWYLFEIAARAENAGADDLELAENLDLANALIWNSIVLNTGVDAKNYPMQATSRGIVWPRIVAAAAVLLVIAGGMLFFISHNSSHIPEDKIDLVNDIKPGTNKAYLTLTNGKKLSLTDAANGALAEEAGVEITKTADGQVIYTMKANEQAGIQALNTIETPNGGQYQLRLPDGSKVWLNAASKLTYPVSFKARKFRIVELSGEAYFEVAKDKKHPFYVRTTGQEVEVLGTHFNVSAYHNEAFIRTTLLEGAVKVSNTGGASSLNKPVVRLIPGQQSMLEDQKLSVSAADVEEAVAWKNGYFAFHDEKIESILRKLSRWYNIEVRYEGDIPDVIFDGDMPRNLTLSQVLKALEAVDVHFTLKGNKLLVTP